METLEKLRNGIEQLPKWLLQKVIFPLVMTVMMSAIIHTTVTMRETFASAVGSSTKDRIDST